MATSTIKYNDNGSSDSAWKEGDTTTTRPIKYRLRNGICFINAFYSGEVTIGDTLTLITTLSEEYRPTITVYFPATNRGSSSHGYGYVDTDGKLYLRNTLGGMGYFSFDVSYPVK